MDTTTTRGPSPSALDSPLPAPTLVVCAADAAQPPLYSFQVNFPRVELVLAGAYRNTLCDRHGEPAERTLTPGQCLVIPANCWNKPIWDEDVTVLSLLFGKRQLGLSRTSWSAPEQAFVNVVKQSHPLSANSPVHLMLQALVHFAGDETAAHACLLAQSIIAFARHVLAQPQSAETSWPRRLFENVCIYLQENFHKTISRDTVAERFNISANYLSRLFQQQGDIGFAEYLIFVRLERAKFLLRRYAFPLEEVSHRCGFRDVKYFCRLFKNRFGQTPTEYRREGQVP